MHVHCYYPYTVLLSYQLQHAHLHVTVAGQYKMSVKNSTSMERSCISSTLYSIFIRYIHINYLASRVTCTHSFKSSKVKLLGKRALNVCISLAIV